MASPSSKRKIKRMESMSKHSKYEETAKRKQILSIRTSKSDDVQEWDAIVNWLQEIGNGSAKEGLYKLAKKNEII
jgi:hypothetical protein